MSIRQRIIELLGGQMAEDADELPSSTGDPCGDEGHDVLEITSATARDPVARRCKRCGQWLDAKLQPIPFPPNQSA